MSRLRPLLFLFCAFVPVSAFFLLSLPTTAQTNEQGVRVIESNNSHLVLEIIAPSETLTPRTLNGATFLDLTIPGWDYTGEAGKPRVPMYGTLVAIPQNARVTMKVLTDE